MREDTRHTKSKPTASASHNSTLVAQRVCVKRFVKVDAECFEG